MPQSNLNSVSVTDLQGGQSYWRALYYFNLYRLLVATGIVTLAISDSDMAPLGRDQPTLFLAAGSGLLFVAVVSLITITASRPPFRLQAYLQFSLDAVLITALSHASGGVDSGLNLLLMASVAAGGVVLSGRMSLFFAAFATLLALAQQTLDVLLSPIAEPHNSFVLVGLLGIGYFSTGGIVAWLARRFHVVEAAIQVREATAARLDRLNDAIVSKSTVGIVVLGKDQHCRLANDQARWMLDLPAQTDPLPKDFIEQSLTAAAGNDTFGLDYRSPVTSIRVQGVRVDEQEGEIALFLEDLTQTEREARNLKLAALGRLTASLAHEILNPLEAISHAGELLAESGDLTGQNKKLTQIIENHTNRINTIVKSVLQLGKPGSVHRVDLEVRPWLEDFCSRFNAGPGMDNALAVDAGDIGVRVDPDQLNQILTNLCDNALRHTQDPPARPSITLRCFAEPRTGAVCLDVFDRGQGVPADIRDKIFEPFFTSSHYGMGLGLFLARELAENNEGELDYVVEGNAGHFRLRLEKAAPPESESNPRMSHG
ncbi:MAG: Sensor protein ZraS [Gammaproteobacteria bacterium]|nr:Sensor protein ZraS [Gammaproteobacteria bacterium]